MTNHYPRIEEITKPTLTTAEAAYYLNRRPQTLRVWACLENGPLIPSRMGGRCMWRLSEVKALLGVV